MKIVTAKVLLLSILFGTCSAVLAEEGKEHKDEHKHYHFHGWKTLFDGESLKGWRGYKQEEVRGWSVEDGTLHRKDKGGDIMTVAEYDNFELTLEWKVAEGANSGIMYRVRKGDGAPYMSGVEYQILDNAKHRDGKSPLTSAGSLYAMYPADQKAVKPVGEWNKTRILLNKNHVEHWLNGKKLVDVELWGKDWNEKFAKSKFKGWKQFGKPKKGHIALQDHGDPVWFRNIKLREIHNHESHEKEGEHKEAAAAK